MPRNIAPKDDHVGGVYPLLLVWLQVEGEMHENGEGRPPGSHWANALTSQDYNQNCKQQWFLPAIVSTDTISNICISWRLLVPSQIYILALASMIMFFVFDESLTPMGKWFQTGVWAEIFTGSTASLVLFSISLFPGSCSVQHSGPGCREANWSASWSGQAE